MRQPYIKHVILTLVLLALDWLAIYFGLEGEFRRHGEGEPEMPMAFAYIGRVLQIPACLLLVAGCLVFCYMARDGVTRRLQIGLALTYLPLLLLVGFILLAAVFAVSENLFFIPAILTGLWLLGYTVCCFPRNQIARLTPGDGAVR